MRNKGALNGNVFVKKEKESGKLRMAGGSWTINIADTKGLVIEKFRYITENRTYEIPYHKAYGQGFIKSFRGEDKLVVPIKHWTIS